MSTFESQIDTGLAVEALGSNADSAAIDEFLRDKSFPLAEGPFCTFVYRGAADAVDLRHWIIGLPSTQPMQRIEGTDLWYLVMEVPERSRFEYKLEVHHQGDTRLIQDPRNPLLARDPFGANSVCQATGYETPFWTKVDTGVRQGWLEEREVYSHAFGENRPVTIYYPYRYRPTSKYPLLIVHDGLDYVHYAAFKTVLDNLIDRHEIPKMIVALTQAGDRFAEYAASNAHADFLAKDLVPELESALPLLGTPESRTLMGASLGAVASLHAAVCHPGTFKNLFLSSGSFAFTDIGDHQKGPIFDRIVEFVNDFRRSPHHVADRVFVTCGTYESLIYENRSLVPVLQRSGMEVRYVEARDGHNWENWRDRLREGLSWLSPGPLWMVYE
jgi:enterochelin esterase-like enzyme